MARANRWILKKPSRFRGKEVAWSIAQLDELTTQLFDEDVKGITKDELAWQPAPGYNTIGMLLAHLAIVETYWVQRAIERPETLSIPAVIGIGLDDDGLPLAADGAPPANLAGRGLPYYKGLLKKSRAYVHKQTSRLRDADLSKKLTWTRKNGEKAVADYRWVLFHLVEHFAAHQGQINLMRHQYRDRKRG